jgi:hypothetical protein
MSGRPIPSCAGTSRSVGFGAFVVVTLRCVIDLLVYFTTRFIGAFGASIVSYDEDRREYLLYILTTVFVIVCSSNEEV